MMGRLEVSLFNLQYTLPNNLRHLLIRNTITDDEPECNKPCGKHRCKVCKRINTATNVLINRKTFKPGNHNCDSANFVYLIQCQKCPEALYIGETGGNFRYIFNYHKHTIRQKKLLPLPLHFNADDHNINDLKVCILKGNFKDTKHRKLTELQFLINFETNKFGLKNTFLSSVNMILLSIKVKYFQLQCHPFLAVILSYTNSYRH